MRSVQGVHAVREALRASPGRVRKVVFEGSMDARKNELAALAREHGVPVYRERPSSAGAHQGVWCEVADFSWTPLEAILETARPPAFLLALDQVEDPRNLGAVVRAADGAGVDGILVPERRSAPPSDVAVEASAGALHHARIARVRNLSDALDELKQRGLWVVGLSPDAPAAWHGFDFTVPVVVVLGSEGRGLRPRVARSCDALVSLPQLGRVASLNLSVAAGIVLYEVVRQRSATRG